MTHLLPLIFTAMLTTQYPTQTGYVTDAAGILAADDAQRLNAELSRYEKETANEVVVVTIPSLNGLSIEDYTSALWQRWEVGKASKNNGVILILAPTEKKIRIQRGIGFRGVLTDQAADDIIKNTIVPQYRMGDKAAALFAGVSAIERVLTPAVPAHAPYVVPKTAAKAPAALTTPAPPTDYSDLLSILCLVCLCVFVFMALRWKRQEMDRQRQERRDERDRVDAELAAERMRSVTRTAARVAAQETTAATPMATHTTAPSPMQAATKTVAPYVMPTQPSPPWPPIQAAPQPRKAAQARPSTRSGRPSSRTSSTSHTETHHHHYNSTPAVVLVETSHRSHTPPSSHRSSYDDTSSSSSSSSWGGSSDGGGSSGDSGGGSSDGGGSSGDL